MPREATETGTPAGALPGEPAAPSASDVLRGRYLSAGLLGSLGAALAGFFDGSMTGAMTLVQGGLIAFCVATLLLLRLRPGADLVTIGRVFAVALAGSVLAISLLRLEFQWPLVIADLPAVMIFSMLMAGHRLALALASASVVALCGVLLLLGAAAPPHLGPQLYGLCASLLLATLYFTRFAAIVSEGTESLAASVRALQQARRDSLTIAQLLSERVAKAVEALARAVREGPAEASAAVEVATQVLTESRRSVPPEPVLPEVQVGAQLKALRSQAMDLSIVVLGLFDLLGLVRLALQGPRENLPIGLLGVLSVLATAIVRWWRPAWRRPATMAMWVVGFALSVPIVWGWYARAPVAPPGLTPQLMSTVFLSALFGAQLAAIALVCAAVVNLAALAAHPGVPPASVLSVIAVYALTAWVVWSWPRALLEELERQRNAAAASIRARRRLVATLFHDLANPMMVISGTLQLLAAGRGDPNGPRGLEDMVARMRASLAAALSGQVVLREIEAGPLCDEVERLFHRRLHQKHVALEVKGAREARLRGDLALLRDSVLANLVSNALKFSPEGTTIEVSVRRAPGAVELLVEDRGPGLPPEVEAALARGRRAPSTPGTGGEPGSGFGLMLAQDYLSAMGGQLELTARPGGGLTARVVLPQA